MDSELSKDAWLRLQEIKRAGEDVADLYDQIFQALRSLPTIPIILRRQNRFIIPVGKWHLALREQDGRLTILDIAPRFPS